MTKPLRGRRGLLGVVGVLLVVLLGGGYGYWALTRALPPPMPSYRVRRLRIRTSAGSLAWPDRESAVGVAAARVLETHGTQTPVPIASTAKLITALSVLSVRPLDVGEQGPRITLSHADVRIFRVYAAEGGSVVRVAAGEQISERQMLEAMLLPSANNIADSLAVWAFGSLPAYARFANAYLGQLGLAHTHVGRDASGFDPTTTSTASDLVTLGQIVMGNPVLRAIVAQRAARGIPLVGTVKNIDFLLGRAGIVGVKTGNTSQAGGVFVGAATLHVGARPTTIVTAVMGAPTLLAAEQSSLSLIKSVEANFRPVTVIRAGAAVGSYRSPWAPPTTARASRSLSIATWHGSTVEVTVTLRALAADTRGGRPVGSLRVKTTPARDRPPVAVTLARRPGQPSTWWRLLHP